MTPTDQALSYINRYAKTRASEGDECLRTIGLDQLDKMTIANEIETDFAVELSDGEVFRWAYVGDVAASIARLRRVAA